MRYLSDVPHGNIGRETPDFVVALTRWQWYQEMLMAARNDSINHYRIEWDNKLGEGGMGEVYLCFHTWLKRPGALKMLSADLAGDDCARQRFTREAEILATLDHPNIARVYDFFSHQQQYYLVMEFVEGQSLRSYLAQERPGRQDALRIGREIASGLEAAHLREIIHRDLKPGNVMLSFVDQSVTILDYGLAKCLRADSTSLDHETLTHSGAVMGTPGYLSPQQALGMPADVRDDVWAFGCVLYECLAGCRAFPGRGIAAYMAAMQQEVDWSALPPDLGQDILNLLSQCLAVEPAKRLAHIGEARQRLDAALQSDRDATEVIPPAEKVPNNLPVARTGGIGRIDLIDQLEKTLDSDRLLTLTGPAGCGKTWLATQLARRRLERHPDGVWLIELTSLTDASLLGSAAAGALGITAKSDEPIEQTIIESLQEKSTMLVFDNCEHLLAACASFVDRLICACPQLSIIATSQQLLDIEGEHVREVPRMSLPEQCDEASIETIVQSESVELFLTRAKSNNSKFQLTEYNAAPICRICRQLEGIPLAIELAAARTRQMPVNDIAGRLDRCMDVLTDGAGHGRSRRRTLRTAIDWSYGLLTEPQRALFRRLSVFRGGWTLEDAEAVCPDESAGEQSERAFTAAEVMNLLGSLVDKSLVIFESDDRGTGRYSMLQTIHQYADTLLDQHEETRPLATRHLEHYLQLSEAAEPELAGGALQADWLQRLETEHDNLLGAIETAMSDSTLHQHGLRLCSAIHRFWYLRGHTRLGRAKLQTLLAHCKENCDDLVAQGHNHIGILAFGLREFEAAEQYYRESLKLWRQLGRREREAAVLNNLGILALEIKAFDCCAEPLNAALEVYREIGDQRNIATVQLNLGALANEQKQFDEARAHLSDCLATFIQNGDQHSQAIAEHNLGTIACVNKQHEQARRHLRNSLLLKWRLSDTRGVLASLNWIIKTELSAERPESAARWFAVAEQLRRMHDVQLSKESTQEAAFYESELKNQLGDEKLDELRAEAAGRNLQNILAESGFA